MALLWVIVSLMILMLLEEAALLLAVGFLRDFPLAVHPLGSPDSGLRLAHVFPYGRHRTFPVLSGR